MFNDNPKIIIDKLKYDNMDYRNLRFLNSNSKSWVQMTVDKSKLYEGDYLFSVMTQLVITYDDVFTK
jgi:hypothetical protein